MFKYLAFSLLILANAARAAVSSVTLPLNWTTADGISRSNLNLNPIALRDAHNAVVDSLNPILSVLTGLGTSIRLAAPQDLIFKVDSDNNGANRFYILNGNVDTLLRVNEDSTAKFFGPVTAANGLGLSGISLHGISSGDARLPGATAGIFYGYSSSAEAEYDLHADGGHNAGWDAYRHSDDDVGPQSFLIKSRGTWGTESNVQVSDQLGDYGWQAYYGAGWRESGMMRLYASAVGSGYVSGDLAILLADGSGTPAERVRVKAGGNITLSASTAAISSNSSDATDNKRLVFAGGGAAGSTRGGYLVAFGNEYASEAGSLVLTAGNVGTGSISLRTGADVDRLTINATGDAQFTGTLGATGKFTATDTSVALLGFRAGNTAASNVNLYRSGADMWTTPDSLTVSGAIVTPATLVVGARSVSDPVDGILINRSLTGSTPSGLDVIPSCANGVTTCSGLYTQSRIANGATVSAATGIFVDANTIGSGGASVGSQFGVYIGDISGATAQNFALRTNQGKVRFGDSLVVDKSITYAATTTPPSPASSGAIRQYQRGSMIVFQYNDAGTVRYKYLDMAGTGVTWVHSTSAP